jgi:hypothetical protein
METIPTVNGESAIFHRFSDCYKYKSGYGCIRLYESILGDHWGFFLPIQDSGTNTSQLPVNTGIGILSVFPQSILLFSTKYQQLKIKTRPNPSRLAKPHSKKTI